MTRTGWLTPLSLGLLLACDAAGPTSPAVTAPSALTVEDVEIYIDVQPLGDAAVINLTTGQPLTLRLVGWPDETFFTTYGADNLRLVYADPDPAPGADPNVYVMPLHWQRILNHPGGHIKVVNEYDEEGNVTATSYYFVLHFALEEVDGYVDGDVVTMCLTDVAGSFSYCDDVTVHRRGGQAR